MFDTMQHGDDGMCNCGISLADKYNYSHLSVGDVISNMKQDLQVGSYFLRMSDGKFDRNISMEWDTPWIFSEKAPERACLLWHRVMFGRFGMLPEWCRKHCWKVVVKPRTLEQLFMLKELQEMMRVPSKLGIETRQSVFGNYGGYFYTNSKEEGLDRMEEVRQNVNTHISKDIPVYLKLGCTEFEHRFGRSDEYRPITDFERKNEDTIRGCFVIHAVDPAQPQHLKDYIAQKWIHYAWSHGDATVMKFNNGEPLFPETIKYQKEATA